MLRGSLERHFMKNLSTLSVRQLTRTISPNCQLARTISTNCQLTQTIHVCCNITNNCIAVSHRRSSSSLPSYDKPSFPPLPHQPNDSINISDILKKIQSEVKIDPNGKNNNTDINNTDYWVEQAPSLRQLPSLYLQLSKSRLTTLVVLTALAGYGFAPVHGSLTCLVALTTGTFLCSASANACNQVMEAPFDSQMDRCKQRVMVRHLLSPLHGITFSVTAGLTGVCILYNLVNPLTAALGAANTLLYAGVYTTMKRYTIANTWLGSIVGAIPPAMGWAAATGTLDWGALTLCGLLYLWQFPHFMALSHNVRQDYCRAGYNMLSVVDTSKNALVSLRNTLALIPLCAVIPFTGISHCSFSFYSLAVNAYFSYLAWNFYKDPNKQSARELFRFSLVYLPIIFGFLAIGYAFKERTAADENKHHVEGKYLADLCPVLPGNASSGTMTTTCPVTGKGRGE